MSKEFTPIAPDYAFMAVCFKCKRKVEIPQSSFSSFSQPIPNCWARIDMKFEYNSDNLGIFRHEGGKHLFCPDCLLKLGLPACYFEHGKLPKSDDLATQLIDVIEQIVLDRMQEGT